MVRLPAALAAIAMSACAGPDHLTEMVISQGGNYFASFSELSTPSSNGGAANTSGASASGGNGLGASTSNGSRPAGGAAPFDWGSSGFDVSGGNGVSYQGHFTGMACHASCHSHNFTAAGTLYQADGTTPLANAQIGILVDGTLTTTYSGSQGNFYVTFGNSVNWSGAQMAIRTATGTSVMPANSNANGNCNDCHNSSNRIVAP